MQRKGFYYGLWMTTMIGFMTVSTALALEDDNKLQTYSSVSGVSGKLKSIGSDTLNNLMTLWSEGFRFYYTSVKIEVEGKGSSTAPPALIQGASQFGPMSREMKPKEAGASTCPSI